MAGRKQYRSSQRFRDLALANRDMTDVTFENAVEISSAVGLMKAVETAVDDYAGEDEFAKWRRIFVDIVSIAHVHGVDIDIHRKLQ